MVSVPAKAFASNMAWRNEPAPLLLVFVTKNTVSAWIVECLDNGQPIDTAKTTTKPAETKFLTELSRLHIYSILALVQRFILVSLDNPLKTFLFYCNLSLQT